MSVKIGDFLLGIGALSKDQIEEIFNAQKAGDGRKFGEIAIARGYMDGSALTKFEEFNASN
ncbi:MAG: hypothetical protein ACLQMF_05625 [Rectinemataceae bacterium]